LGRKQYYDRGVESAVNSNLYTEDHLVERPSIQLFAELGWTTVSAVEELIGQNGMLAPETKWEVMLVRRLRTALQALNPVLPPEAINFAIDELARDRSAMSLAAANREVWKLIRDDVRVSVADLVYREMKIPARRR
jgi:type I restriction enzyme R subunit